MKVTHKFLIVFIQWQPSWIFQIPQGSSVVSHKFWACRLSSLVNHILTLSKCHCTVYGKICVTKFRSFIISISNIWQLYILLVSLLFSFRSATFVDLDKKVKLPYTKGSWKGVLGSDIVSFVSLPNVTVTTKLACITSSEKFFVKDAHWQGILGLAYSAIARVCMILLIPSDHSNYKFSIK